MPTEPRQNDPPQKKKTRANRRLSTPEKIQLVAVFRELEPTYADNPLTSAQMVKVARGVIKRKIEYRAIKKLLAKYEVKVVCRNAAAKPNAKRRKVLVKPNDKDLIEAMQAGKEEFTQLPAETQAEVVNYLKRHKEVFLVDRTSVGDTAEQLRGPAGKWLSEDAIRFAQKLAKVVWDFRAQGRKSDEAKEATRKLKQNKLKQRETQPVLEPDERLGTLIDDPNDPAVWLRQLKHLAFKAGGWAKLRNIVDLFLE